MNSDLLAYFAKAISPLEVGLAGSSRKLSVVVANASTDTIVFQDQSANKFIRWDDAALNLLLGNTAGSVVLGGTTRVVRRKTTYTNLTYDPVMVIDLTGTESQKLTQLGAMSVAVSNAGDGQRVRLELVGDGNAITWSADLIAHTIGAALPASVAAGKIALFEFESPGVTLSVVRVRFLGVQA